MKSKHPRERKALKAAEMGRCLELPDLAPAHQRRVVGTRAHSLKTLDLASPKMLLLLMAEEGMPKRKSGRQGVVTGDVGKSRSPCLKEKPPPAPCLHLSGWWGLGYGTKTQRSIASPVWPMGQGCRED